LKSSFLQDLPFMAYNGDNSEVVRRAGSHTRNLAGNPYLARQAL